MTRPRLGRVVCLAAVAAASAAAALWYGAPPAHGAPYIVVGCSEPPYMNTPGHVTRATDGWQPEALIGPGADTCHEGAPGRGLYAVSYGPFAGFRFNAPSGTTVTDLWTWHSAHVPLGSALVADALRDGRWVAVPPARTADSSPLELAAYSHATFAAASALRIGVACIWSYCLQTPSVEVRTVEVGIDDPAPPLLDPLTPELDGANLGLELGALDHGSGVASLRATLAGHEISAWHAGGSCTRLVDLVVAGVPHYEAAVPCPHTAARDATVDTSTFPDGDHDLTVRAEDAAGNAATATKRVRLDNHPPGPGSVRVSGRATVGELLAAEPSGFAGQDPKLTLAWERCEEQGEPCTPIAAGGEYTLTTADAGSRLRVRATAIDGGGTTTATSLLTAVVAAPTPAPTIAAAPAPLPGPTTTVVVTAAPQAPIVQPLGKARLTAWFDGPYGRHVLTRRVRRGAHVRVRGRLTDASGRAIAGAALSLVEYVGGRALRASGTTTRADGRFTTFTRLGPPRRLRFTYQGVNGPLLRLTLRR